MTSADIAGEGYTLVWEARKLFELSSALSSFASSALVSQSASMAVKHTVLASVMVALALPGVLIAASDIIDNPWGVCVEAANAAGIELANVLLERVQGSRPVTLVGYSMGALVIASALRELSKREECHGIVEVLWPSCFTVAPATHCKTTVVKLTPRGLPLFLTLRMCTFLVLQHPDRVSTGITLRWSCLAAF